MGKAYIETGTGHMHLHRNKMLWAEVWTINETDKIDSCFVAKKREAYEELMRCHGSTRTYLYIYGLIGLSYVCYVVDVYIYIEYYTITI